MKKLLLVLFVSAIFVGNIYSQSFIGKNKTQAKKELLTGGGRVSDIKSFGYDGYVCVWLKSATMYGVLFNKQGICFLEFATENNRFVVDKKISHLCGNNSNHVYRIDPNISKEHEFIEGKTTIEVVVEPSIWCFYIFQPKYKQDVLDYFEKRYEKEYSNIAEREYKEKQKELKAREISVDEDKIEETVYNYNKNFALKKMEDWNVLKEPRKEKINVVTTVFVCVDSLNTSIVKIDDDVIDKELNILYNMASPYCVMNNINYSKYQNFIFYKKQIYKTITLEKNVYGLKNNNSKFKYYKTVPNEVKEWCQNNIKQNGFHAVEHINYDEQTIIKLITITKEEKRELQGNKSFKIWSTIGAALVLGVGLGFI